MVFTGVPGIAFATSTPSLTKSYGAAQDGLFTATYAQPTNRIKWEVQERW